MRRTILLFSMIIIMLPLSFAQQQLGSIGGTVTDSTGAAVKQATVNPAIPNPIPALRIAWRSHRGVRTASASRADCAADKCRKRIGGEKVLVDASAADLNFASS